tara:strand:- start:1660 stop:1944 length:285 start_codon:yes stop_codon:yes gene_type:complete
MPRYHATPEGRVQFTAEEEIQFDKMTSDYLAGADDRAAAKVREDRNAKLTVTDWTAFSDVTMSDAMETYRQALRDVPAQSGFPNTITWPTEPGT